VRPLRQGAGGSHADLLGELRGLVNARDLLDRAIKEAISACHDAGVDATAVADALGVHRSTLYRRFITEAA
jgi:transcriptional regulator of acetoin/glycerol metabolism